MQPSQSKPIKAKLIFLSLLTASLLLCCKKQMNDTSGTISTKNTLLAHSWIYDSSRLFFPDTNYLITYAQSDVIDNFTDTLWISTNKTTNKKDTFIYECIKPDTLYRWQPPQIKNPIEYFLLNKITDDYLNLIYRNQSYSSSEYFHSN